MRAFGEVRRLAVRVLVVFAATVWLGACSLAVQFDRDRIVDGAVEDGGPGVDAGDVDGGPEVDGPVADGSGMDGPMTDGGPGTDGGGTDGGAGTDGGGMCPDLTGMYDGAASGPGCVGTADGTVTITDGASTCALMFASTATVEGNATADTAGEFMDETLTIGTDMRNDCDGSYAPGSGILTIDCGAAGTRCTVTLTPM